MNSVFTFPADADKANLPHAWGDAPIQPAHNDYVASTPFHTEGMNWAKNYVRNRARINAHNKAVYGIGGYRNQIPKPQPQGSFARPLATSGNGIYGGATAGFMDGAGGSFRTAEGSQYGIDRLQARARQLEEMALHMEEGLPMEQQREGIVARPSAAPPVPLTAAETDMTAFDLILNELEGQILSTSMGAQEGITSGIEGVKLEEVRKMIGLLKKMLLGLSLGDLQEYARRIAELYETTATALSDDEYMAEIGSAQERKLILVQDTLFRMNELIKVAIASINKDPKERKTFVDSFAKKITRAKVADLRGQTDEAISRLAKVPNYLLQEESTLAADRVATDLEAQQDATDYGDDGGWDAGRTRLQTLDSYRQPTTTMSGTSESTDTGLNDQRFTEGTYDSQAAQITRPTASMATAILTQPLIPLQQSAGDDFATSGAAAAGIPADAWGVNSWYSRPATAIRMSQKPVRQVAQPSEAFTAEQQQGIYATPKLKHAPSTDMTGYTPLKDASTASSSVATTIPYVAPSESSKNSTASSAVPKKGTIAKLSRQSTLTDDKIDSMKLSELDGQLKLLQVKGRSRAVTKAAKRELLKQAVAGKAGKSKPRGRHVPKKGKGKAAPKPKPKGKGKGKK